MLGPEQLDIFVPLHRSERLREWAELAREHHIELEQPSSVPAFAGWLRENGHTPPGLSNEAVDVLVAVMKDYAGEGLRHER